MKARELLNILEETLMKGKEGLYFFCYLRVLALAVSFGFLFSRAGKLIRRFLGGED